jgi:hypothetical protein
VSYHAMAVVLFCEIQVLIFGSLLVTVLIGLD